MGISLEGCMGTSWNPEEGVQLGLVSKEHQLQAAASISMLSASASLASLSLHTLSLPLLSGLLLYLYLKTFLGPWHQ